MRTNYDDIGTMHAKFNMPYYSGQPPHLIPTDLALFRITFMTEELAEYMAAVVAGDLPKAADALVDLVTVALGTAQLMHLPWQDLWNEVFKANMAKERGTNAKRGHFGMDLVKPPGWSPPAIYDVLVANGYK